MTRKEFRALKRAARYSVYYNNGLNGKRAVARRLRQMEKK